MPRSPDEIVLTYCQVLHDDIGDALWPSSVLMSQFLWELRDKGDDGAGTEAAEGSSAHNNPSLCILTPQTAGAVVELGAGSGLLVCLFQASREVSAPVGELCVPMLVACFYFSHRALSQLVSVRGGFTRPTTRGLQTFLPTARRTLGGMAI